MSNGNKITSGEQLYQLLPEVYRTRDESKDLENYLESCGTLLDQIHDILKQRLTDSFPDEPLVGEPCQPWLIPYFGDLLDVHFVSPDVVGQRAEVSHAIEWRQKKGTLACIEDIAQEIGLLEVEIQEGWKRVAVTPTIGKPLLPPAFLGDTREFKSSDPPQFATKHPGLPVSTIDLRVPSRAAVDTKSNATKHTKFEETDSEQPWKQINYHGMPCFPDSFQDVSRRIVDVRTPNQYQGLHHPKRILLYFPKLEGFFPKEFEQLVSWADVENNPKSLEEILYIDSNSERMQILNRTNKSVKITGPVGFDNAKNYEIQGVVFDEALTITSRHLMLTDVAAPAVTVDGIDQSNEHETFITATGCLFGSLSLIFNPANPLKDGFPTAQLEYCTILGDITADRLYASDSIFNGKMIRQDGGPPRDGCIRFTRFEETFQDEIKSDSVSQLIISRFNSTTKAPIFYETTYGNQGCGVLHPNTPHAICFGAEDGGEMGAYHSRSNYGNEVRTYYDQRPSLRRQAILAKLKDFLPVGMEAILIPDRTFECIPPMLLELSE